MHAFKKITMVAALGLVAGVALAQQDAPALSRAQVVAELDAARAAGQLGIMNGEDSGSFYLARQSTPSHVTRAEVVAEMQAARAAGQLGVMSGEDSGSFYLASYRTPSTRTRGEVIAEMQAARAAGQLGVMTGEDSGSFYLSQQTVVDSGLRVARSDSARQAH
jgi:hypothetical protein